MFQWPFRTFQDKFIFSKKNIQHPQWALYCRRDCEVNTNMTNENYNKQIKPKGTLFRSVAKFSAKFFLLSMKLSKRLIFQNSSDQVFSFLYSNQIP